MNCSEQGEFLYQHLRRQGLKVGYFFCFYKNNLNVRQRKQTKMLIYNDPHQINAVPECADSVMNGLKWFMEFC